MKTFFFYFLESTCGCVLGPWPRAFLSLASRVSVLGKAVLGLGLGFFLCPWPWPRALCPRLHLWFRDFGFTTRKPPRKFGVKSGLSQKRLKYGKKYFIWLYVSRSEVESRTQGSRPRPRTQKKSETKDSLSEDRHSRGQGQECSRPRPRTKDTGESLLLEKRSSKIFFRRSPIHWCTKNF